MRTAAIGQSLITVVYSWSYLTALGIERRCDNQQNACNLAHANTKYCGVPAVLLYGITSLGTVYKDAG
jgi:hypothetical protein